VVALAVLLAVIVAQDGEDVRSVENNTDYGNKSSAAPQYTIKQLKRERSICKLLQMRHYVKCMVDDSIHNRNCAVFFAKPCPRADIVTKKPRLLDPNKAPHRSKPEGPGLTRVPAVLGFPHLAKNLSRPIGHHEDDKAQQKDYLHIHGTVENHTVVPFNISDVGFNVTVEEAPADLGEKVAKWKDASSIMENVMAARAKAGAAFFLTPAEKKADYTKMLAKNREKGEKLWEQSENAADRRSPKYSDYEEPSMKDPCVECDDKFTYDELTKMEEWDVEDKERRLAAFRDSIAEEVAAEN